MIPVSTIRKIIRNILGLFPYHIRHVQELKPQDYELRLNIANRVATELIKNRKWTQYIFWSDGTHFYLYGRVNTRDCVVWAEERPHAVVEKPFHDQKVTVWCGFTASFITGGCTITPFFIQIRI